MQKNGKNRGQIAQKNAAWFEDAPKHKKAFLSDVSVLLKGWILQF